MVLHRVWASIGSSLRAKRGIRGRGRAPRAPTRPMKARLVKIWVPTSQENSPGVFPSLGGWHHASIALLSVDAALLRRRSSLRSTCAANRQEDRQIRKTALSAHYQASRPPRSGAYRPSLRAPGGELRGREPALVASIAGGNGDGRVQQPNGQCQTTEDTFLRRFGHFPARGLSNPRVGRCETGRGTRLPRIHRRSGRRCTPQTLQNAVQNRGEEPSPWFCTAFARPSPPPSAPGAEMCGEGHPLRRVHRWAKRRWTGPTAPRTVQNDGGESPPPFCPVCMPRSPNTAVVGCERAKVHLPPRVSIAGRDGDARRKPPNRRSKTAEESLLHRLGRLVCRDRRSHPCCVAKRGEGRPP